MTSNAYIATDGETIMKVGKANDVKRREKQIAIRITRTVVCLDEGAALRVESKLREFVVKRGGIRYRTTIDWFHFDQQIYNMLCEFVAGLNNEPAAEVDVDTEIAEYITRYHQLLVEEISAEKERVIRENLKLEEKIKWLQRNNDERQEHIIKLCRELGAWDARWKILHEALEKKVSMDELKHLVERLDKLALTD